MQVFATPVYPILYPYPYSGSTVLVLAPFGAFLQVKVVY